MVTSAAALAANAAATAKAVKAAAPTGPKIKPARGVTTALVGSLLVVGVAQVKGSGSALDPRPFIATFGVFIVVGFIAEANPALGRMLALLAFVAILLARGEDALTGLLGTTTQGRVTNTRKKSARIRKQQESGKADRPTGTQR
jgi:hypothetical protein